MLSAKLMGAERIIAMSRHESRQKLAREFGATDVVTERGDEGVARIQEPAGSEDRRNHHRRGKHRGKGACPRRAGFDPALPAGRGGRPPTSPLVRVG